MKKTYTINNLDCAHCGGKIEELIAGMTGVESAVLNFPLKKLTVTGNITADFTEQMNKLARTVEADVEIVPNEKNPAVMKTYTVNNLDCAHCGGKIEELIAGMTGIESAVLNFPLKKLTVTGNIDEDTLELMNDLAQAVEAGVEIVPFEEVATTKTAEEKKKIPEFVPLVIGIILFVMALITENLTSIKVLPLLLFIGAYLSLGFNVIKSAVKNIGSGNFFDENFLMTVATIGAFALGEYSEAVGVVLFFRIGELFENHAVSQSRKAITDIAGLKADFADVMKNGEFVRTPAENIKVGDVLRIKAGERIAVDGIVESGESRIDTSAVNGEPVPLTVRIGDEILSGCINLSESFTLRATAVASESMISKIAEAVEDASASKPKIDRFITKFSKVYTPIVLAVAVLTAIVPSLITGEWHKWVYSALTFLVISCPCALVLSVPLAYFSGIGVASKLGILFKGGSAIEALAGVKTIAFDKTGTLTNGSFSVTDVRTFDGMTSEKLLEICVSCEKSSTHPVAESIVEYGEKNSVKAVMPEKVTELAGRGISAVINGENILCGNKRLMDENNIAVPEYDSIGSTVYVAVGGTVKGIITVSDTVKKTSASAVSALKSMGIKTAMLTGDKADNALSVSQKLGIDYVKGDLMPDGKLHEIERIRKENGSVMFIGDGINDAPVLAGADVGGAMQNGSDLALEASDAVFMNSEPETVVRAKRIADRTLKVAYQNIIFALAIKAVVLILGLFGHPNMWLAVFADSGTAMLLILNSVKILNSKKYQ
ncbi:MAG: cadmium-translocating P-type ATPase [Ruminococcus flavefaciens]|nr:cadmium-translocating P-type ATPase [Ruminococcus flavefaciens]